MKYFTELKLSGYKSIQDVTVKLHPGINIFIGPNGSGKSNLLTFISYLKKEILDLEIPYFVECKWEINGDKFHKKVSHTYNTNHQDLSLLTQIKDIESRLYDLVSSVNTYSIEQNGKEVYSSLNESSLTNEEITNFLVEKKLRFHLVNSISYIKFVDNEIEKFVSQPNRIKIDEVEVWSFMIETNSLFASILGLSLIGITHKDFNGLNIEPVEFLKKSFKFSSKEVIEIFKKFSDVHDIRIKNSVFAETKNNKLYFENLQLEFKLKDGWYSWDDLSDGTKRIITIVYRVYYSGEIVLLEEPELGIHPHQLLKLLHFLKEQAYTKQIILSTHSPEVLDVLSTEQLDNINLVSIKKGKTFVKKLNKSQKEKAHHYLEEAGSIGDYWKHSDLEI